MTVTSWPAPAMSARPPLGVGTPDNGDPPAPVTEGGGSLSASFCGRVRRPSDVLETALRPKEADRNNRTSECCCCSPHKVQASLVAQALRTPAPSASRGFLRHLTTSNLDTRHELLLRRVVLSPADGSLCRGSRRCFQRRHAVFTAEPQWRVSVVLAHNESTCKPPLTSGNDTRSKEVVIELVCVQTGSLLCWHVSLCVHLT